MNPDGELDSLPLPAGDGEVTLFAAWSVFTHVFERDAAFYLGEIARVLAPGRRGDHDLVPLRQARLPDDAGRSRTRSSSATSIRPTP